MNEDMSQIRVWFNVVSFACFNKAIKIRTGMGTTDRVTEEPVFSSNYKGFDGALRAVVVCALLRGICSVGANPPRLLLLRAGSTLE